MEGKSQEEITRLQRDPEPGDLQTTRAWGFLDVFDSDGKFVRVATVEEKRRSLRSAGTDVERPLGASSEKKTDQSSDFDGEVRSQHEQEGRREAGAEFFLGLRFSRLRQQEWWGWGIVWEGREIFLLVSPVRIRGWK